jgi:hypothetical protein
MLFELDDVIDDVLIGDDVPAGADQKAGNGIGRGERSQSAGEKREVEGGGESLGFGFRASARRSRKSSRYSTTGPMARSSRFAT